MTALVGVMCFLYNYTLSIKASRLLFASLTSAVLRAPLRWLDTVPTGRVLNRFTADFDTVDNKLACNLMLTADSALDALGICVAANLGTRYLLAPAAALVLICAWLGDTYLTAARPMRRLESTARSPMFELYSAVLAGITTIRAAGNGASYLAKMHEQLDAFGTASRHLSLADRWLSLRMVAAGTAFAGAAGCLVLLTDGIGAPLAGFVMSFSLDFAGAMIWVVRCYSRAELNMNSAERVVEYAGIETEDAGGARPPAAWPACGRVEVEQLVVGYAEDLPAVLKGVSFCVEAGTRVGVVGRTGAGKSSFTLALFRFLEARSGRIVIDGVDISGVNLHELRSRLAIIPQVKKPLIPLSFSGPMGDKLADTPRTRSSSRARFARTSTRSRSTRTRNSSTLFLAPISLTSRSPVLSPSLVATSLRASASSSASRAPSSHDHVCSYSTRRRRRWIRQRIGSSSGQLGMSFRGAV